MNGLRGGRRTASPVRLTLCPALGSDIDGAWWPHTGSVARELPELIGSLHPALGEVVDININWSSTAGAPVLNTMSAGHMAKMGWSDRGQRLMVVVGKTARAPADRHPAHHLGPWPGWCCAVRPRHADSACGTKDFGVSDRRPGGSFGRGGKRGVGRTRGRRPDDAEKQRAGTA